MKVVFGWRATQPLERVVELLPRRDAGAVERPLGVRGSSSQRSLSGVDRFPERLRIADVDRDRHAQLAGAARTADPGRGRRPAAGAAVGAGIAEAQPLGDLEADARPAASPRQLRRHRVAVVRSRVAHQPKSGVVNTAMRPPLSAAAPAASRACCAAGPDTCPTGSRRRRSPIRSSGAPRARCRRARCACGRRCGETARHGVGFGAGAGGDGAASIGVAVPTADAPPASASATGYRRLRTHDEAASTTATPPPPPADQVTARRASGSRRRSPCLRPWAGRLRRAGRALQLDVHLQRLRAAARLRPVRAADHPLVRLEAVLANGDGVRGVGSTSLLAYGVLPTLLPSITTSAPVGDDVILRTPPSPPAPLRRSSPLGRLRPPGVPRRAWPFRLVWRRPLAGAASAYGGVVARRLLRLRPAAPPLFGGWALFLVPTSTGSWPLCLPPPFRPAPA